MAIKSYQKFTAKKEVQVVDTTYLPFSYAGTDKSGFTTYSVNDNFQFSSPSISSLRNIKDSSTGSFVYSHDETGHSSKTFTEVSVIYKFTAQGSLQEWKREEIRAVGIKIALIETIQAEEGTYPDDGMHTDGYWYVLLPNQTPTISGRDLDLGGIKQPFNHSYTIDDKDTTQELSITITKSWLSSPETIGNAVRNQNYTTGISQDEFNSLELNKQHKITITVSDGAGAKYSRYISFRRINTAPTVTVNRDMGEQNVPFDITYRVADLENDIVNVEFLHEGKLIGNQSNVDKETELTWSIPNLEYIKMPNGYNEITIRAIDVNGASSASLVGFTKNVHGCGIEHGIEVDEVVDFCIADCKRELAKELDGENVEILKVQACNNYGDDEPSWEDIPLGKIYRFVNKTAVNAPKVGVRFEVLSDPQIGNSYLSNFVFKWGWEE